MKELIVCDECGSLFFKGSSQMEALCPECAHVLYGYPNCPHHFRNGRCVNCYWDGSESGYIKYLKKESTGGNNHAYNRMGEQIRIN